MQNDSERKASDSFRLVCRPGSLRAAWERVEESDGCAGIDGVTLARFARRLEAELERLRVELLAGVYRALPLLRFAVPKGDGGERLLCIPAVRDRVAQHAVIGGIGPVFEAEFEACSFAYRRGRSVRQALREVERWREAGYVWVVEADITAYFDNIDHGLLLERAGELVRDASVLRLIEGWVAARVYDGRRLQTMRKGVPQGSPISPLLANLYLDSFDEEVNAGGRKLVRFADDFLILCRTKPKAEQALHLTRRLMESLQLTLRADRTRVTNFAAGFKYLGAVFTHSFCLPRAGRRSEGRVRMPPRLTLLGDVPRASFNPALKDALIRALKEAEDGDVLSCLTSEREGHGTMKTNELKEEAQAADSTLAATGAAGDVKMESAGEASDEPSAATGAADDAIDAPGMALPGDEARLFPPPLLFNLRTLYLHEHGATVSCEQERLRVVKDEVEMLSLPLCKVDQIVLFGNSQITTSVMKLCLRKHIPILLLSGSGRFLGSIEAASDHNVELQQRQFERRREPGFALDVARRMVEGKIGNCRTLLQRRGRVAPDERVTRAIEQRQKLKHSLARAATLDEVRGYEGAASAAYYAGLAACFAAPFAFTGRTRRPPCDPVNALLSFGYTLLSQNIYALARGRGLSPYVGLLHELRQGHPALCSDLIEELRAPIVDSLVTAMINKRVFAVTDFYYEDADEPDEAGAEATTKSEGRGCRMTDAARRKFIAQFEQRMSGAVMHPRARLRTTWRGCIDLQIGHYIRVLRGEAEHYLPLEIR